MSNSENEVVLTVNGTRYSGWKSIRITRSIEGFCGSFGLDVSDRWGDGVGWPIKEGDACRVEIGGIVVIDGYVDKRELAGSADSRTLAYTGRDRAADLVDCSALIHMNATVDLDWLTGKPIAVPGATKKKKWTFNNVDIAKFASELAKPHGIKVSVEEGLKLARVTTFSIEPGDSPFQALTKAAQIDGVLLVSDGAGGILITRSGTAHAYSLVEGQNILSASVTYDSTERFHRYLVTTQSPSTDEDYGESTQLEAEAIDLGCPRTNRVLLIRADKVHSLADARKRADWEARIRAAKSETVTISVQGWRQGNGSLWPINAVVHVTAPRMVGVDGDMLISEVEYSIGESGSVTQLRLVRPDAFTPEPTAVVKGSTFGAWPEHDPKASTKGGAITVPKGVDPGK